MSREFSHIVGELRQGEPATIRFYGKITEESASRFMMKVKTIADDVQFHSDC